MPYSFLLSAHSLVRWGILAAVVITLSCAVLRLIRPSVAGNLHRLLPLYVGLLDLQLALGVLVYAVSPWPQVFRSTGTHLLPFTEASFFGFWHPVGMILAVAFAHAGKALAVSHPVRSTGPALLVLSGLAALLMIPWWRLGNASPS